MKTGKPRKTRRMRFGRGYVIGLSLFVIGGIVGLVIALTRGGPGPASWGSPGPM